MNIKISPKLVVQLLKTSWEESGGFLFITQDAVLRIRGELPLKKPMAIFFNRSGWSSKDDMTDAILSMGKPASWLTSLVDIRSLEYYLTSGVTIPSGL